MYHPYIHMKVECVDDPKCIATKWQGNLENTGSKAMHRLSDLSLATLGGNRQRVNAG